MRWDAHVNKAASMKILRLQVRMMMNETEWERKREREGEASLQPSFFFVFSSCFLWLLLVPVVVVVVVAATRAPSPVLHLQSSISKSWMDISLLRSFPSAPTTRIQCTLAKYNKWVKSENNKNSKIKTKRCSSWSTMFFSTPSDDDADDDVMIPRYAVEYWTRLFSFPEKREKNDQLISLISLSISLSHMHVSERERKRKREKEKSTP